MRHTQIPNTVGVVLAAGAGARMGFPKAMLRHPRGHSFLTQCCAVLERAGCAVIAVVGKDAERVRSAHPSLELVVHPGWEAGQLTTARCGLERALNAGAHCIVLHPVDVPNVQSETVRLLIHTLKEGEAVIPRCGETPGHPLVLSRAVAETILRDDVSPHLEAALEQIRVTHVDVQDLGVSENINTRADYFAAFRQEPTAVDSAD